MRSLLVLAAAVPLTLAAARAERPAPSAVARAEARAGAEDALQMVVSTTADWDAVDAVLQRYERASAEEAWRPVGAPVAASVGRAGLGWGSGLHADPAMDGPVKREGDGKAPAGIFRLSSVFGYAPAAETGWIRLPYVQTDSSVECVDDLRSRFYNRRVDRDTIPAPDWQSHEELRRADEVYRWGVWVDHNSDPPAPGGGSCIFLHVHAGPGVATSGCTAMDEAALRGILAWLDPRARPVLVQLPRAAYDALRGGWRLP